MHVLSFAQVNCRVRWAGWRECRPVLPTWLVVDAASSSCSSETHTTPWTATPCTGTIPKLPANLLLVKNLTAHGIYWWAPAVHSLLGPSCISLVFYFNSWACMHAWRTVFGRRWRLLP